jgi:hypothetical protein
MPVSYKAGRLVFGELSYEGPTGGTLRYDLICPLSHRKGPHSRFIFLSHI